MRRITLVCEPPDGGVAEHVNQLARGLPAYGYEPVVVVPWEYAHRQSLSKRCEVLTLPLRRDYSHPQDELRSILGLLPIVRGTQLVHGHSAKAGVVARVVAKALRKPAVYTPHAFPFVGEISSARRRFGAVVERALAPHTDALICVCEDERLLAVKYKLRPRHIEVVYNGCPTPELGSGVELDAAPRGLVVGTICVLRRQKAIDCLLDAMPAIAAAVPGTKLVIVGQGPLEAELRSHASRIGVDVSWQPFEPPSAKYLQQFDVYVLSSAWEAFPIGVLEAQASGIPQVVSAVGGAPEAVSPETGIVVPPRDSAALARAVIELLKDSPRRKAMSEMSRRRHREKFTVERMVAETAAVYDHVLNAETEGEFNVRRLPSA